MTQSAQDILERIAAYFPGMFDNVRQHESPPPDPHRLLCARIDRVQPCAFYGLSFFVRGYKDWDSLPYMARIYDYTSVPETRPPSVRLSIHHFDGLPQLAPNRSGIETAAALLPQDGEHHSGCALFVTMRCGAFICRNNPATNVRRC